MTARTVRIWLWAILCAAVLWGMLDYRSADPDFLSYSATHLATIGMAGLAMLCGTRALLGAPSRAWDAAFLVLALFPAVLFGGKNLVLRREFALGEIATTALVGVAVVRLWPLNLRGVLDGSLRQGIKVVLVNGAVLVGVLILAEGFARLFLSGFDPAHRTENEYGSPFWLQFQPFLMFSTDGPVDLRFRNARKPGETELGHVVTNNLGFRMAEPVRFDTSRPKAPGERVVLLADRPRGERARPPTKRPSRRACKRS